MVAFLFGRDSVSIYSMPECTYIYIYIFVIYLIIFRLVQAERRAGINWEHIVEFCLYLHCIYACNMGEIVRYLCSGSLCSGMIVLLLVKVDGNTLDVRPLEKNGIY